jgi:hypothetical protein
MCDFKRSNVVTSCADDLEISVIYAKDFYVELLIALLYHLVFLLTAHIVFVLVTYSTMNPNRFFEICSLFDVLLISKELKHWETILKISYDIFHSISSKIVCVNLCCILTKARYVHYTVRHNVLQAAQACVNKPLDCATYSTRVDRTGGVCVLQRPLNLPYLWFRFSFELSISCWQLSKCLAADTAPTFSMHFFRRLWFTIIKAGTFLHESFHHCVTQTMFHGGR